MGRADYYEEAVKFAGLKVIELKPHCNVKGNQKEVKTNRVRCLNDEMEFDTIAEAAKYYEIPRTSLSNHLNGVYGYSHVRNYRFKRIG